MKHQEHTPKTRTAKSLFFALLSNLLRAKGAGAPCRPSSALNPFAAPAGIAEPTGAQSARVAPSETRTRTKSRAVCAAAICVAVAMALPAGAAAKQARLFAASFGSATSPIPNPYPLAGEGGQVAVDQSSHDVYVTDPVNRRVEKFDSAGHFLLMIGKEVNKGKAEAGTFTEAEQNLCAAGEECQPGVPSSTPGGFEAGPEFIAVDNSGLPGQQGDLYVSEVGGGRNENQGVYIKGGTGGSYRLSFEGQQTGPITYNAKPAAIQAALEALSTIGAGNVNVTAFLGIEGPLIDDEVEFVGTLSATDVPEMTIDASALSATEALIVTGSSGSPGAFPNVSKFGPEGHLIASWGNNGEGHEIDGPPDGQLNGANAAAGPFTEIEGLATDPAGNLWVVSGGNTKGGNNSKEATLEFRSNGDFVTELKGVSGSGSGLAVDAEDNLYLDNLATKYNSAGEKIGHVVDQESQKRATSIAVEQSTGELYVGVTRGEEKFIDRYDSSCHPFPNSGGHGCQPAESFGLPLFTGVVHGPELAVDPAAAGDPVYALIGHGGSVPRLAEILTFSRQTVPDVLTTKPANPTHTSATLTATVNPSGIKLNEGTQGCRFEWVEAALYEPAAANPYAAGHTVPCDKSAAEIGNGGSPVEVQAPITGLEAGKTYHYRLVATNENDENEFIHEPSFGSDLVFGPPLIESVSVTSVAATSADLQAEVDPKNLDTHLRLEYVTQAHFEAVGFAEPSSTEVKDIGSAGTPQIASFHLAGLSADTVYRYRAFAENILGEGPEAQIGPEPPPALTTQPLAAFALPDHRAWELVSPSDKRGARIEPLSETGVIQASASGDAISYLATAPTESQPQGNSNQAQILSARSPAGWQSRDIAPPHESGTGLGAGEGQEYRFFSPDLSRAVLQPLGPFTPQVSSEATEQTPFLRTNFPAVEPTAFCAASCYRPIVSAANVTPEGTQFGEASLCVPLGLSPTQCGPYFLGASPDAAHAVLLSAVPLIEGAPAGTKGNGLLGSLYEWDGSAPPSAQLQLLSVRPGASGAVPASARPILGSSSNARNAISTDGSRVIFSEAEGQHHLYLRGTEAGNEQTIQLDTKQQGASGAGPVSPRFQTASDDGSRVFFTDAQQLTPDSAAAPEKPDLYECQVLINEEGELECKLTDLTPAPSPSESAAVLGSVIGASRDGSYVYFVANGVLASNVVENGAGLEEATPGSCSLNEIEPKRPGATCNLYLSHAGHTSFLAALSEADRPDWAQLIQMPARVSSDGGFLAFMSKRSLTGYDNRDIATGQPDEEVYLYRAPVEEGEAGKLICASCDPTGARPRGLSFRGGTEAPLVSKPYLQFDVPVAASLPSWTQVSFVVGSFHQPRYLSDSGRLFFNSFDALFPSDSNGTEDVYQYEPPAGEGTSTGDGCNASSSTYSPASGGCIELVSSGTSKEESILLDASESGSDVFFLTTAQLSRRDSDVAPDVYDARVGGGEPQPARPVECEGDGCQQPVVPPNDPTPGSLTFNGAGNLHETQAKEHKKKHRKRKTHRKHKRVNSNRGGHR